MNNHRNTLAILINPPIYDTQYWARWSMPHGLLKIAAWLRKSGYDARLLDCLNPYAQNSGIMERNTEFESYNAVRKQKKSVVVLASTEERVEPASYHLKPNEKWKYIFGMPLDTLEAHLQGLKQEYLSKGFQNVEVWVTSIMTYWWESTRDVIQLALTTFPDAKIRVGGIYPTLAPDHAVQKLGLSPLRISGQDLDLDNTSMMENHLIVTGEVPPASNMDLATDLYTDDERPPYTILTTSRGCPHICSYCASNVLNGGTTVRSRSFKDVIAEIKDKFRKGTRVFCFYEDNLLMNMQEFKSILKAVLADKSLHGISLYAPEGIEIGIAMSDRKRYLLKLKTSKDILATFSVESGATELAQKRTYIKMEEDLTKGSVEVVRQDDDSMTLLVGDTEEVVLRKLLRPNGRHEIEFTNEGSDELGLYLTGVPEVIYLMRLAGMEKIYLPLETIKKETNSRWNRSWNSNLDKFESLLNCLSEIGFDPRKQKVNAFVMFGLPGEDLEEIYDTALYASERVGSVIPMLFTPVPSTKVFDQYRGYFDEHGFDLQHLNGKLFPMFHLLKAQGQLLHPEHEVTLSDYIRLEGFMQRLNTKVFGESVNIYGNSRVSNAFRQVYGQRRTVIDKFPFL